MPVIARRECFEEFLDSMALLAVTNACTPAYPEEFTCDRCPYAQTCEHAFGPLSYPLGECPEGANGS